MFNEFLTFHYDLQPNHDRLDQISHGEDLMPFSTDGISSLLCQKVNTKHLLLVAKTQVVVPFFDFENNMYLALLTLTSSFALKRTQIILSNTSFMPHDNLSVAPRRAVAIVKSSLEWMCLKIFTLSSAQ